MGIYLGYSIRVFIEGFMVFIEGFIWPEEASSFYGHRNCYIGTVDGTHSPRIGAAEDRAVVQSHFRIGDLI